MRILPKVPMMTCIGLLVWVALLQSNPTLLAGYSRRKPHVSWWHRLLGLVWLEPEFFRPFPPPIAFVAVLSWKLEMCLYHALDIFLLCLRLALGTPLPSWSLSEAERRAGIVRASSRTGLGDLIMNGVHACFVAKQLGVPTVAVDWRESLYLSDQNANLFELLFDVPTRSAEQAARDAAAGEPSIIPVSQARDHL